MNTLSEEMVIVILRINKEPVEHPNKSQLSDPLVSVSVKTYQHADFISDCLDGILNQKTDFEYEILLGEDDSTDGTRDICLEYANNHPKKIRLFLHHRENVIHINGSPTGRFNSLYNYTKARGKYIALCEGDDSWTDPNKLQKQVDLLESNDDFVMASHAVKTVYLGVEEKDPFGRPKQETSFEDLLTMTHFIPTLSIVFRKKYIDDLPDWYQNLWVGDIPLVLLLTLHGKNFYFYEKMGLKRKHSSGISQRPERQKQEYKQFANSSKLIMYKEIRKMHGNKKLFNPFIVNFTLYSFHNEIKRRNIIKAIKHLSSSFYYSPLLSMKFILNRIFK